MRLLLTHEANRDLLAERLGAASDFEVVTGPGDEGADVCLVDPGGLRDHADWLEAWQSGDVYRPCLLVTERPPGELPAEMRDQVDDVVELPTTWGELQGRLQQHLHERDRTLRIAAEREGLREQNERLRTFASRLAHDLRNPLSVAQGYLEEARGAGNEELSIVASALERMERLVGETLTLARLGQTAVDRDRVDLEAVARDAWGNVETGPATLSVEGGATLSADRNRLLSLLENLFRNAIEHAGPDVTVTVGTVSDGFYVADDGPGIDPGDREMVFEVGYTTNEEGTGFGLRIVREIADAHGWSVALADGDEGGARFEVRDVDLLPATAG